jgi:hypothetical protein
MKRPETAGLYENVPFADYLAWEAESRTGLVAMAKSPAEYLRAKERELKASLAMKRGTGVDTLLFEGRAALAKALTVVPQRMDELPAHFVEAPDDPKMYNPETKRWLKAGQVWKKEQEVAGKVIVCPHHWKEGGLSLQGQGGPGQTWKKETEAAGGQIVPRSTIDEIEGCAEAARANGDACYYLGLGHDGETATGCIWQPSILWQDEATGIWCKCRPDALRLLPSYAVLGDLKITDDPRPEDLGGHYHRHIRQMRYDWQGGFYCAGVSAVTGLRCDAFYLIAIEAQGLHRIEPHVIDDNDADPADNYPGALSHGAAGIFAQLSLLAQWRKFPEDQWPKESGKIHQFTRTKFQRR